MPAPDAHVLIVDDEDGIRELLQEVLEGHGYRCDTAPDGVVALELLSLDRYDLAIVDIIMPGMSGISLFENILRDWPNMAVIFATGVNEVDSAVDSLKSGAYDYLVKPFNRRTLLEAVEDALVKRGAQQQAGA